MIITHNGNAVNGIDVAKYQGQIVLPPEKPDWLWFMGIKATDVQKVGEGGIDPFFQTNREAAADMEVLFRSYYCYLRDPNEWGDIADQVALFCQTVGRIGQGESVYVDWEDHAVTLEHFYEVERILDVVYPNRWMVYVNDVTPDMTDWLGANTEVTDPIPVFHPNYGAEGWQEADRWDACIWQVGIHPGGLELYPQAQGIDVNWIVRPDVVMRVHGFEGATWGGATA